MVIFGEAQHSAGVVLNTNISDGSDLDEQEIALYGHPTISINCTPWVLQLVKHCCQKCWRLQAQLWIHMLL